MQKLALILLFVTLCLSQTNFPGTYRDFKFPENGYRHEDFNIQSCLTIPGLLLNTLAADGRPVRNNAVSPGDCIIDFTSWYHDSSYTATVIINHPFTLAAGKFSYESGTADPGGAARLIDGLGFGNEGRAHNSLFTLHLHSRFTYLGTEPTLDYLGDDDFWVYMNKKLALDQGGRHSCQGGSITLSSSVAAGLGLTVNGQFDFDFFIAERQFSGYCVRIQMPGNSLPDAPCTQDTDNDGVPDCRDNCVNVNNTDQKDCNRNGIGDACDTVAGTLEYPYVYFAHQNYDGTKDLNDPTSLYYQTSAFENIPNVGSAGLTKAINDALPVNALSEYRLRLFMAFQSTATENCEIQYSITGDQVGTSPVYTAVVVHNNVFYCLFWSY
jgi:fibro-slime domain-containing protein